MTRSKSHRDYPPPPPAPDVTDSPASAHDPWSHDYGPRPMHDNAPARDPDPDPPARGSGSSFTEAMRRVDPALADRFDQARRRKDR